MKSPTGELRHLRAEANTERPSSGFTGGLDLYDELINFLSLTPEPQQAVNHFETPGTVAPPAPVTAPSAPTTDFALAVTPQANPLAAASGEAMPLAPAANSGALSESEDVIRITGALEGFVGAKTADSAKVTCGDCGNPSDAGEMFCIHCGGLLEQAVASAETAFVLAGLCDDCGAMIESDEIFCPSCGSVTAT